MGLRYYTNMISQASRGIATWIFMAGLLLIGFGVIIIALPEVFAFLAAAVFFIIGLGCVLTAIRIFLAIWKMQKKQSQDSEPYRDNVRIHIHQ